MNIAKTHQPGQEPISRPRHRGFTLIELLVATAVTLLLVAAISQAFAIVSKTVTINRATLEMSGQLRGVAVRLETDLDQVTAPLEPWLDSGAGLGYFEYIEGPGNDWDSNNDNEHNSNTNQNPNRFNRYLTYEDYQSRDNVANPIRFIDAKEIPSANSVGGDLDDVLMFTVRSSAEPFVGQVLGTLGPPDQFGRRQLLYDPAIPTFTTIQSDTAEIIWWTRGGTLYRRVLLVRPDILLIDPDLSERSNPDMPDAFFFSANDLSVRVEPRTTRRLRARFVRVTNSLADLTLRQNRYAHQRLDPTIPVGPVGSARTNGLLNDFPYPVLAGLLTAKTNVYRRGTDSAWGTPGDDDGDGTSDELDEAGWPGSDDVLIRYAVGEDVIITNMLGFDVRAYDPGAQVRVYLDPISGDPIQRLLPGDPAFFSPNAPNNTAAASLGGYVDLGYRIHPDFQTIADNANAGLKRLSQFSGLPHFGSNLPNFRRLTLATFDTWPVDYERDGLDQDNQYGIDQATDGLDTAVNDPVAVQLAQKNGVDDPAERETSPPYMFPLRGLQVRIRVIDPDTRQFRQMTVAAEFTQE